MTQTVLAPDAVRTPARWAMATEERSGGFVMATMVGRELHVHVGDPTATSRHPQERAGGLVTAILDEAGAALVETTGVPPALLLARDGLRVLPAQPGLHRRTALAVGDRLVLCSASGADGPPGGFLHLLRCSAAALLDMSADRLLDEMLDGVDHGAATVISRLQPQPPEAARREDRA